MSNAQWPSLVKGPATDGYLNWPIPAELDHQIAALIAASDDGQGPDLRPGLDPEVAEVLGCFAQRAAVMAVRLDDPRWLQWAVVALGLSVQASDYREVLVVLTLVADAARRMGLQPSTVVGEAETVDPDVTERFGLFVNRMPPTTPEEMGWQAAGSGANFSYVRYSPYS